MEIYIVRHATAESTPKEGGGDAARALTPEGKKKMRQAAAGFAKLEPEVTRIFTSPLIRARQTARIVSEAIGFQNDVEEMEELAPGSSPADVVKKLQKIRNIKGVVLTGHEPNCSELASYLLAGSNAFEIKFKKGGICLIECRDLQPGSGVLRWLLPPSALRQMSV